MPNEPNIPVNLEKWQWFDVLDALEYYKPSLVVPLQDAINEIKFKIKQSLSQNDETSKKDVNQQEKK